MPLLLALGALAGPPVITSDGGVLTGTVELQVAAATLRGHMVDPTWMPRTTDSTATVSTTGSDGACLLVHVENPSPLMTLTWDTRRCPTETGYHGALVASNSFESYEESWTIEPTAEGSRATYRLHVVSRIWGVPRGIVRKASRGAIERALTGLQAWDQRQARPAP
jgi:hypothetical protein